MSTPLAAAEHRFCLRCSWRRRSPTPIHSTSHLAPTSTRPSLSSLNDSPNASRLISLPLFTRTFEISCSGASESSCVPKIDEGRRVFLDQHRFCIATLKASIVTSSVLLTLIFWIAAQRYYCTGSPVRPTAHTHADIHSFKRERRDVQNAAVRHSRWLRHIQRDVTVTTERRSTVLTQVLKYRSSYRHSFSLVTHPCGNIGTSRASLMPV